MPLYQYVLPEIILGSSVAVMLILFSFQSGRQAAAARLASLAVLCCAFAALFPFFMWQPVYLSSFHLVCDPFAAFFKIIAVSVAFFVVILDFRTGENAAEYYILLLISILGVFISASAADMVMIALGIEITVIPLYFAGARNTVPAGMNDVALKYFLFGSLGIAFLLTGFSLLYGYTGKTDIYEIHRILGYSSLDRTLIYAAFALILSGIALKTGFVPFHFWYPDCLEKSQTSVALFIAHIPMLSGLAVLIRSLLIIWSEPGLYPAYQWMPFSIPSWPAVIIFLGILTMTLGSVAMLLQENIKRFLAYSSLSHLGFLTLGLIACSGFGLKALMFYLVVFFIANSGLFVVISEWEYISGNAAIGGLRGLGRRNFFLGFALVCFLLSLAGFPAFAGFPGKFYILSALVETRHFWITGIALMNGLIAFYAYIRIINMIFSGEGRKRKGEKFSRLTMAVTIILLIPVIYLGFDWKPLLNWTALSAKILLYPHELLGGF